MLYSTNVHTCLHARRDPPRLHTADTLPRQRTRLRAWLVFISPVATAAATVRVHSLCFSNATAGTTSARVTPTHARARGRQRATTTTHTAERPVRACILCSLAWPCSWRRWPMRRPCSVRSGTGSARRAYRCVHVVGVSVDIGSYCISQLCLTVQRPTAQAASRIQPVHSPLCIPQAAIRPPSSALLRASLRVQRHVTEQLKQKAPTLRCPRYAECRYTLEVSEVETLMRGVACINTPLFRRFTHPRTWCGVFTKRCVWSMVV